jgi:hypothetical protein
MKKIGVLAEGLRSKWQGALVPALLFALVVLIGCGELQSPVAPVSSDRMAATLQGEADLLSFSPENVLTFLTPPDLEGTRHAGKLIRARKGGFVELNGFRVDIPAGALARDTFVTIDLPTTLPEANYIVADFGPTGLQFKKPVGVTLPLTNANLAGVDLSTVGVGFWNGSEWEDYGGTATPAAVSSTTTHFSTYGARRGGIDTTSGG